jgi:putative membrane protein
MLRKAASLLLVLYAVGSLVVVAVGLAGVQVPPPVTASMTGLAFSFALLHGADHLGWKKTVLLVGLTFVISLAFESIGVATGLIYGPYHYTDKLGPKFLGLVPYLIPLAWFMMMYPSYIIAARVTPAHLPARLRGFSIAALAALAMTAWDLAMDPFMVQADHWVWDAPGAYFGIPVQNFFGWWVTSFITIGAFTWFARPSQRLEASPADHRFTRLAILSYAITAASSLATDLTLGLYGPALVGLFAMLPWILLGLFSQNRPVL